MQSAAIQVGRPQVTTLRLFFPKESRRHYFKSTAPQVVASKPNKCNQQTQASSSQSWRSCTNAESPAKQRSKMAPAHRQPRRPLCPPVLAAPWARGTVCFEKWRSDGILLGVLIKVVFVSDPCLTIAYHLPHPDWLTLLLLIHD